MRELRGCVLYLLGCLRVAWLVGGFPPGDFLPLLSGGADVFADADDGAAVVYAATAARAANADADGAAAVVDDGVTDIPTADDKTDGADVVADVAGVPDDVSGATAEADDDAVAVAGGDSDAADAADESDDAGVVADAVLEVDPVTVAVAGAGADGDGEATLRLRVPGLMTACCVPGWSFAGRHLGAALHGAPGPTSPSVFSFRPSLHWLFLLRFVAGSRRDCSLPPCGTPGWWASPHRR
jgi:hypothetical protein